VAATAPPLQAAPLPRRAARGRADGAYLRAGFDAVEVFQQKNTGGAMHLGKRKSDIGLGATAELNQFGGGLGIVQIGESF
jgi:hypothetical protein